MEIIRVVCGDYAENAYLILPEGRTDAFVIDPGDDIHALITAIEDSGRVLTDIILTHGHFDHTLCAASLKARYGTAVSIADADAAYLSDPALAFLPQECVSRYTPISADKSLMPGLTEVCGVTLTVIPTPGHTPGSVCLIAENEKVMFSGDTLFAEGFGRTDLAGGSMRSLMSSLRVIFALDPELTVYPGHARAEKLGVILKGYHK